MLIALCVALMVISVFLATPVLRMLNVAEELPSGTTTPAGSVSDRLEPFSATFAPPAGAGPVNVTVPTIVAVPDAVTLAVDTDWRPLTDTGATNGDA